MPEHHLRTGREGGTFALNCCCTLGLRGVDISATKTNIVSN